MKRHPALIRLSSDHHQALLLSQLIKKNAPKYFTLPNNIIDKMNYAKEIYKKELEHHFKDEEELLFPYIKGKDESLDKLISEIMDEHIVLKNKILGLIENPDLPDQLDEISKILELHVRKEERQVFEKTQALLSNDELEVIKNNFDKSRNDFPKI